LIIENLTFQLAPGVDEGAFLTADAAVQTEFYSPLPGFVRRTTARGDGGEWLVATFWGTAVEADGAAVLARTDAANAAFLACTEPATLQTHRFETLE
jgi:hypothetical protein